MKTSKKTIRKVSFALLSLFLSMSFIFQDSNVLSKLQAAAIFYPRTSAPSKSDYHYYSDNPFINLVMVCQTVQLMLGVEHMKF